MNNMGSITKREIEAFARRSLKGAGFTGWKMEWTNAGSYCFRGSQTIVIDKSYIGQYPWVTKEVVIHEMAHIYPITDSGHGTMFYKEYIRLLNLLML